MLQEIYQAPPAKIDLIPHGIPDMPFVDPNYYKDQFGVEGRMVLLTFGLLSPNKGIEHVLNALPAILAEFPEVVYIVVGATHPNELREQGEAYRLSLERLAKKNKVDKNVIFYNRFVELEELKEFIGAADLYITPVSQRSADHLGDAGVRVRRGQGRGLDPVLARGGTAGGRPRRAGAVRRRPGHRARGDRVAARRHPPPRHAQERLQAGPRDGVEQHGAAVHALLRAGAARKGRRCRASRSPRRRSTSSRATCRGDARSSLADDRFDGDVPARHPHRAELFRRLLHGRQRARVHSRGAARRAGGGAGDACGRWRPRTRRSCTTRSIPTRSASTIT